MELFWFFPTFGDGRYLGTQVGSRAITLEYLTQIATAIDDLGFTGALLPTGRGCEDAWITASLLAPATKRLKFLVAVRPGLMTPGQAARMTATLDRFSGGRLLINVVAGGDAAELAGDGITLDHDERYELTDEFLEVWRKFLVRERVEFEGKHIQSQGGQLTIFAMQKPYPALYFGGSSPAAHDVAAKHVDVYLTWGEPPEKVAEKIEDMRKRAADQGRTLRFGIRLHVIVRETESEAWAAADNLIRYVSDEAIAASKANLARIQSEGQRRMAELHDGDRSKLVVGPNLWAGVGLVRGGTGTALVGDPEQVAARMREYADVGCETFIFSGYPHLEEAYRVADLLFPVLGITAPHTAERQANEARGDRRYGDAGAQASQAAQVMARDIMSTPGGVSPSHLGRRISRSITPWFVPISGLALWQIASWCGWLPPRLVPSPLEVAKTAVRLTATGELPYNVAISAKRAVLGFLLGGGLGLALGMLNGLSNVCERLFDTTIQMARAVPHLALIPLIILWLGVGEMAKISLVALGAVFPLYINTLHGLRSVDPGLIELGRVLGLSQVELIRRIVLPGALPSILVGVRYGLGLMWLGLIVAETISADAGIGYMAMHAREFFLADVVVLSILLYAMLGKGADAATRFLEHQLMPWRPTEEMRKQ